MPHVACDRCTEQVVLDGRLYWRRPGGGVLLVCPAASSTAAVAGGGRWVMRRGHGGPRPASLVHLPRHHVVRRDGPRLSQAHCMLDSLLRGVRFCNLLVQVLGAAPRWTGARGGSGVTTSESAARRRVPTNAAAAGQQWINSRRSQHLLAARARDVKRCFLSYLLRFGRSSAISWARETTDGERGTSERRPRWSRGTRTRGLPTTTSARLRP